MKKYCLDLSVRHVERLNDRYVLLKLTTGDGTTLPEMAAGQFVEIRIDNSPTTFLRRPISINFVDREQNELWLLVAVVGEGTRRLANLKAGDLLNCMLPLGNGFSQASDGSSILLVGGGVGVAPLLYQGELLAQQGVKVTFLLGARSAADLLLLDEFKRFGRVLVTTEDGSLGEQGFVTNHSVLNEERFDMIQCCGPTPMMKAVVRYARQSETPCEVSLENMMACGLGACLCCVEKTTEGNLCVCKEGPVFNENRLLW
ncbi:MAG: dihydroorotate dehydrogenase electron transfer subunit [Prevotella sp.]|nr:dihydroorotate dehydrogenase electron transfer subunit [Prevotella sp.]